MGDEQYAETNLSFNPLIATVAGHSAKHRRQ